MLITPLTLVRWKHNNYSTKVGIVISSFFIGYVCIVKVLWSKDVMIIQSYVDDVEAIE